MTINTLLSYLSVALLIIAVLCTFISLLVQATKSLGFIKLIPTILYTMVVSLVVCLLLGLMALSYYNILIYWYYIAGLVILSLIISLLTVFGWDTIISTFKRFYKTKSDILTDKEE